MNILITGATGFLGARTLEHFASIESVNQIIATGRNKKKHNLINNDKVEYILGDLDSTNFVQDLFKKPIDIVINCASLSSPWGSYKDFYSANIQSQENLIKQSQLNNVTRFIYISSPSVYCDGTSKLNCNEIEIPKKRINNYSETKWQAEKLLKMSKLNYAIIRPRALIGRWDTVIMPRLIRAYYERKLFIIGSGKNKVDLTSVSNVVNAIELLIHTDEKNLFQAYNITNDEPILLWEYIELVLLKLGYNPKLKKIPKRIAYILGWFMEKKAVFSKNEPPLTKYSIGTLANDFTLNIDKAKQNIGYKPIQNTKEGLQEFIEWHKKNNYES